MTTPTNEYPTLSKIREGINFRFPVTLRNVSLEMRPLSISEEDRILQEVLTEMSKLPEAHRTSLKQSALLSIKKLALAQTKDAHSKDKKVHEVELSEMTAGELQWIFKEYVAECDKVNPRLEDFSKEQVEGWVSSLKKSSNVETTLIESSFHQLAALCHHLLTTSASPTDKSPG